MSTSGVARGAAEVARGAAGGSPVSGVGDLSDARGERERVTLGLSCSSELVRDLLRLSLSPRLAAAAAELPGCCGNAE